MKIIKEAETDNWWVGKTIKCECGFEAIIEHDDVEVNKYEFFTVMTSMIDFQCKCRRLVTIHQED